MRAIASSGAGLIICCVLSVSAGRTGAARFYAVKSSDENALFSSGVALKLNGDDPIVHQSRARALSRSGDLASAVVEYQSAALLQPFSYRAWLALGDAQQQSGQMDEALTSFSQAVQRAPFYAEPRWRLGNCLLAMGRHREAFGEMSRAAQSNPELLSSLLDLVGKEYGSDASAIEQIVDPQTIGTRLALALFFIERGMIGERISALLRTSSREATGDERRELIEKLIEAKRYVEARQVWVSGNHEVSDAETESGLASIDNPSFETMLHSGDVAFTWQVTHGLETVKVALDENIASQGAHSLRIDFAGNVSNSTVAIISQLVLVEPNTRYRLTWAERTEKIVTGGPPLLTVTDVSGNGQRDLAQSEPLPSGTRDWNNYQVNFTTTPTTRAVLFGIRRQKCVAEPCPCFGSIWFDNFSLRKL